MRAQTTLDFAAGMSLFLVAVAFVFAFVPGLTGPFVDGSGEGLVAADRVADQSAHRLLATGGEPFVLDVACTNAFFAGTDPPPADCRFDGATPHERVGLSDRLSLNVRLEGDADGDGTVDLLCSHDTETGTVVEQSAAECGTPFETGGTPPTNTDSVVVARRTVAIDGRDATLFVRTW